jgi:hypothetical protein
VTDAIDIQRLMERAESAAHSGDFVAAEEALRLAVDLQERTLGATSPEVASTLNNLGIVYERLDRPADAEASYRKAFAIAKAVFDHDHPLVETSATNLREFCDARGIKFEQSMPSPAPVADSVIDDFAEPAPVRAPASRKDVDSASSTRRPIVLGSLVLVAALIAIALFASRRAAPPAPQPATSPVPAPAATTPEPPAPAPVAAPPADRAPAAAAAPLPKAAPSPKPTAPPRQIAPAATVEVLDATLCKSLDLESNWRCDPLPDSTPGGPVYFVTRVKAASDTTIEHRWYRNDRLTQAVSLRVRATGSGYRTYSRTTTSADRAGTWRVELRGAGGAVLSQKTFTVGPS